MHEQERQKRSCFVVLPTIALAIRDRMCYSDDRNSKNSKEAATTHDTRGIYFCRPQRPALQL